MLAGDMSSSFYRHSLKVSLLESFWYTAFSMNAAPLAWKTRKSDSATKCPEL